jgi:hypothetical protein
MVSFSRPITEVAIAPGVPFLRPVLDQAGMVVAAAQDSVYGINPFPNRPLFPLPSFPDTLLWSYKVAGTSRFPGGPPGRAEVISISVTRGGLVSLGILLGPEPPPGGAHAAAFEIIRGDPLSGQATLLHREEFEVVDPASRVPIVSFSTRSKHLLVRDHSKAWRFKFESLGIP